MPPKKPRSLPDESPVESMQTDQAKLIALECELLRTAGLRLYCGSDLHQVSQCLVHPVQQPSLPLREWAPTKQHPLMVSPYK